VAASAIEPAAGGMALTGKPAVQWLVWCLPKPSVVQDAGFCVLTSVVGRLQFLTAAGTDVFRIIREL